MVITATTRTIAITDEWSAIRAAAIIMVGTTAATIRIAARVELRKRAFAEKGRVFAC